MQLLKIQREQKYVLNFDLSLSSDVMCSTASILNLCLISLDR